MVEEKKSNEELQNVKNKTKDISVVNINETGTSLGFVRDLEDLKVFAKGIKDGALCPLKKEEDIIIALTSGKELGLPPIVSLQNIYPINGKSTISTHIIKGLLIKNDVLFKKTKDYKPMFVFYKEVTNTTGEKKKVPVSKGFLEEKPQDTKYDAPIDYITEYEFSRWKHRINGSWFEMIVTSKFSMKNAIQAKLTERGENYDKYPERMLDARAFIIGAREIASDIIFGMYTINELADANNIKYTISENLEEKVIDIEHKE